MKADISRDTFHAARDVRRVIAQQGRPWLDADWNEQVSVLLHRLETLAADVMGEHAAVGDGFSIESNKDALNLAKPRTFGVRRGRYYVHGLMCENDWGLPIDSPDEFENGQSYLVFLHAWEAYESAGEDPSMSEPALRGADTSGRTRVRWKIEWEKAAKKDKAAWDDFETARFKAAPARLKIRVRPGAGSQDPSRADGRSAYRGLENTLYRIEVHADLRLKWARNNASTLVPAVPAAGQLRCEGGVALDESFDASRVVEVHRRGEENVSGSGTLHSVSSVDRAAGTIALSPPPDASGPVFLRPWSGVLETKGDWIPLEHGLEIGVERTAAGGLRAGQYWLIPVRTDGAGQVYWPTDSHGLQRAWQTLDSDVSKAPSAAPEEPDLSTHTTFRPADRKHVRKHYYGPLAVITFDAAGLLDKTSGIVDLRNIR